MKKQLFLLGLILGALSIAYAQTGNPAVHEGPLTKWKKMHFDAFAGSNQTSFTTFGGKRRSYLGYSKSPYFLKSYDRESLELKKEVEVEDWKYGKAKPRFLKAIHTRGEVQLIFDCYDKKKDRYFVLGRSVNGMSLSPYQVLIEVPSQEADEYRPVIATSQDSSKIAIALFGTEGLEYLEPEVAVLTHKLQPLWTKSGLAHGEKDKITRLMDLAVDNEGSIYTVAYNADESEDDAVFSAVFGDMFDNIFVSPNYELGKINPAGQTSVFDLGTYGRFFHSASLKADVSGKLILAGFYSDEDEKKPESFYCLTIDQNNLQPVSENFAPVDKALLADLEHSQKSKLKSMAFTGSSDRLHGFERYKFWDILEGENGSITLVAERKARVSNITASGGGLAGGSMSMSKTYTLVAHDIVVVNLNNQLETQWVSRIPKRQSADASGSGIHVALFSYVMTQDHGKLHFLFNYTNEKERELAAGNADDLSTWMGMRPATYAATVDKGGKVTYTQLPDFTDKSGILMTLQSFSTKPNEVLTVFKGNYTSKSRFVRIEL